MAKIEFPIRINKYLAVNNYATRREADLLIEKGLVFINNKKAILGDKVNEKDKVTFDKVLVLGDVIGHPYVDGAKVTGEIVKQGKQRKIRIFNK